MTDLIERMALVLADIMDDDYASGGMSKDHSQRAQTVLAAIRETHAIVPRELIDDIANSNNGEEWRDACDDLTEWADRNSEVKP